MIPPVEIGRFEGLIKFIRNPAAALPLAVYEKRIVRDRFRPDLYIWTADPEYVAHVLLHAGDVFAKTPVDRRIFEPAIGHGILTSEGATWRWHRKAAAPLFRLSELAQYVPAISAAARRQVAHWRNTVSSKRIVAIDHDMTSVTFDVISNTILAGCGVADSRLIKQAGEQYLDPISWEITFALMHVPRWVPYPGKRRMLAGARALRDAVGRLVASRRVLPEPGNDILGLSDRRRHPETGDGMADEEIIDNLATFLLAGHETTARALTWTLYLLARVQRGSSGSAMKVKRVAGDAPIAASHLDQLKVTEQVIKEAMRLYPPAPVISRQARETTTLGGETIEKGAIVVLPILRSTGTGRIGATPTASIRIALRPSASKRWRARSICRLDLGRAFVSALHSRCWKPKSCLQNLFAARPSNGMVNICPSRSHG